MFFCVPFKERQLRLIGKNEPVVTFLQNDVMIFFLHFCHTFKMKTAVQKARSVLSKIDEHECGNILLSLKMKFPVGGAKRLILFCI